MRDLAFTRWQKETGVRFHWLTPAIVGCMTAEFQRDRRIWADEHATSDPYFVVDDDCLLAAESPVPGLVDLMQRYPDFSIISAWPSNCTIGRWTPEDYSPLVNEDIWEHVSVGNVRCCRKPVQQEWPALRSRGYDNDQCAQIRAEGHRVGLARNFKHVHLGEGYYGLV